MSSSESQSFRGGNHLVQPRFFYLKKSFIYPGLQKALKSAIMGM